MLIVLLVAVMLGPLTEEERERREKKSVQNRARAQYYRGVRRGGLTGLVARVAPLGGAALLVETLGMVP